MPTDEQDSLVEEYRRYTWRKMLFILVIAVGAVVLIGLSLSAGKRDIGFFEVYDVLYRHLCGFTYEFHSDEWWDDSIVWNTRLPRALMAILVGAVLSICGATMQSVLKNPLADPYTTGVSSASSFGMAIALFLGFSITVPADHYGMMFFAFLLGLVPVFVILLVSKMGNSSAATVILAGVAMSYFFSGLRTLIMTLAGDMELSQIFYWQIGSLQSIMWEDLPVVLVVGIIGSVVIGMMSRKLNILSVEEDSARSMGVDTTVYRTICLVTVSIVTAVTVSFCGVIGFIGLVAPHVVRHFIGSDNRFVIPSAAAFGAVFILFCDVVSRIVSPTGSEIPVGVVMSFIGAPIFLCIIIRTRRDLW